MIHGHHLVNVTMETSHTTCRVMQRSKDMCNTTLSDRTLETVVVVCFFLSIADAIDKTFTKKPT